MKMATHRHGSQLSIVTTTVLICALFALPMICSAMPSSGDESVSTERQGVPQSETKVLGEDLDTTEKQPTIQVKEEESMATSEKQKRHSQRTLRIREVIFRRLVRRVIRKDPTLSALFLRLVFHDAYTVDPKTGKGGCNGSIRQELKRVANTGLDKAIRILTPFQRRSRLSWGDVTAVAGAEAVEAAGGPKIRLRLGRRESNGEDPAGILPSPRSNVQTLQASFKSRGFSDLDIASLSGGHTLGKGFGVPFCKHQNTFSNDYFVNLAWFIARQRAKKTTAGGPPSKPNRQFPSDMALLEDRTLKNIVLMFSMSKASFFHCFRGAYLKLVNSGQSF